MAKARKRTSTRGSKWPAVRTVIVAAEGHARGKGTARATAGAIIEGAEGFATITGKRKIGRPLVDDSAALSLMAAIANSTGESSERELARRAIAVNPALLGKAKRINVERRLADRYRKRPAKK